MPPSPRNATNSVPNAEIDLMRLSSMSTELHTWNQLQYEKGRAACNVVYAPNTAIPELAGALTRSGTAAESASASGWPSDG